MIVRSTFLYQRLFAPTRRSIFQRSPLFLREGLAFEQWRLVSTALDASKQGEHCPSISWSYLTSTSSASLPFQSFPKSCITPGRKPLLVLLVTPVHINRLSDGFISTLLRETFKISDSSSHTTVSLDVLAAVVDRIPYPNIPSRTETSGDQVHELKTLSELHSTDGSEGISVAVVDSESAAQGLWSTRKEELEERETMSIEQRCTISFTFNQHAVDAGKNTAQASNQPPVLRGVQLPVTNTLFQNGRTSTLFIQQWESLKSGNELGELECTREKSIPSQVLHIRNGFEEDNENRWDYSFDSCLASITRPRVISDAIGNIIRRIDIDNGADASAPASQELEKAIHQSIQEGSIQAQQVEVWALVRPQNYRILDESPQANDVGRKLDQSSILSGCVLHKILSGGGGWGEKQGLLALDPDVRYGWKPQKLQFLSEDSRDVEAQKTHALGEVVKPGDTVTFYAYNPPLPQEHKVVPQSSSSAKLLSIALPQSIVFGTLPSSMDAMPSMQSIESTERQSRDIIVRNYFGMLSEQGIGLRSFYDVSNPKDAESLRPLSQRFGTVRGRNGKRTIEVLTKLDAPYIKFSLQSKENAPGEGIDLSEKERATSVLHHISQENKPTSAEISQVKFRKAEPSLLEPVDQENREIRSFLAQQPGEYRPSFRRVSPGSEGVSDFLRRQRRRKFANEIRIWYPGGLTMEDFLAGGPFIRPLKLDFSHDPGELVDEEGYLLIKKEPLSVNTPRRRAMYEFMSQKERRKVSPKAMTTPAVLDSLKIARSSRRRKAAMKAHKRRKGTRTRHG